MLKGVYDLTDNRDFIHDIPDNAMKGLNPRALFESPKDYNEFDFKLSNKYRNTWTSDIINTTYNFGPNSYVTITDQHGHTWNWNADIFNNRTISWNSNVSTNGTVDYYNYDTTWKSLYDDIIFDYDDIIFDTEHKLLAKLPWSRNRRKDNYSSNNSVRISDCSVHGKYISWKIITKRGYMHYQSCPKCEARKNDYYKSKEIYPWNTNPKPEDMKQKQKRASHIPIDYKVHHYLLMLPRSILKTLKNNMNLKIREHNVPWANTELRELEKVVDYYINENYHDKRIPWFANMSYGAFREYWEENVIEHEDTEHTNKNPDIIDIDEKEMERYLNMRPGTGNSAWH